MQCEQLMKVSWIYCSIKLRHSFIWKFLLSFLPIPSPHFSISEIFSSALTVVLSLCVIKPTLYFFYFFLKGDNYLFIKLFYSTNIYETLYSFIRYFYRLWGYGGGHNAVELNRIDNTVPFKLDDSNIRKHDFRIRVNIMGVINWKHLCSFSIPYLKKWYSLTFFLSIIFLIEV